MIQKIKSKLRAYFIKEVKEDLEDIINNIEKEKGKEWDDLMVDGSVVLKIEKVLRKRYK